MVSQGEKAAAFRALHDGPGVFVIPNPWDAGSARMLAGLGFQALATSSGEEGAPAGTERLGSIRFRRFDREAAVRGLIAQGRRVEQPRSSEMYCYAENVDRETIKATTAGAEARSLEELAASQGVRPLTEFDALLGHPSAEDESVEEFSAMLREWRRESSSPARQR